MHRRLWRSPARKPATRSAAHMVDTVSGTERSRIMRRVLGKGNQSTEALVARLFRKAGVRGWRRQLDLPGRPDFAFPQSRLAVFVDGCFWHGCPKHLRLPASHRTYWVRKIERNVARDHQVRLLLRRANWRVVRFWEHDLADESGQRRCVNRVVRLLAEPALGEPSSCFTGRGSPCRAFEQPGQGGIVARLAAPHQCQRTTRRGSSA